HSRPRTQQTRSLGRCRFRGMALRRVVAILSSMYIARVGVGHAIAYVLYGWAGVCLVGGLVGLILRPFRRTDEDITVERLYRVLKKPQHLVAAVYLSGIASVLLTFLFVRVVDLRQLFAVPLGIMVGAVVGIILVYAAAIGILEIDQGE